MNTEVAQRRAHRGLRASVIVLFGAVAACGSSEYRRSPSVPSPYAPHWQARFDACVLQESAPKASSPKQRAEECEFPLWVGTGLHSESVPRAREAFGARFRDQYVASVRDGAHPITAEFLAGIDANDSERTCFDRWLSSFEANEGGPRRATEGEDEYFKRRAWFRSSRDAAIQVVDGESMDADDLRLFWSAVLGRTDGSGTEARCSPGSDGANASAPDLHERENVAGGRDGCVGVQPFEAPSCRRFFVRKLLAIEHVAAEARARAAARDEAARVAAAERSRAELMRARREQAERDAAAQDKRPERRISGGRAGSEAERFLRVSAIVETCKRDPECAEQCAGVPGLTEQELIDCRWRSIKAVRAEKERSDREKADREAERIDAESRRMVEVNRRAVEERRAAQESARAAQESARAAAQAQAASAAAARKKAEDSAKCEETCIRQGKPESTCKRVCAQ